MKKLIFILLSIVSTTTFAEDSSLIKEFSQLDPGVIIFGIAAIIFSLSMLIFVIVFTIVKFKEVEIKKSQGKWAIKSTRRDEEEVSPPKKGYRKTQINTDLKNTFENYVKVDGLHYLGMYSVNRKIHSIDILDDEYLSKFIVGRDPEEQRNYYEVMAEKFNRTVRKINEEFKEINQGRLIRTVFDVEAGAIYYYELQFKNKYLIGVTLDETLVNKCDNLMEEAVDSIRGCYNLPPISGVYLDTDTSTT